MGPPNEIFWNKDPQSHCSCWLGICPRDCVLWGLSFGNQRMEGQSATVAWPKRSPTTLGIGMRWEIKALLWSSSCFPFPSTVVHILLELWFNQPQDFQPRSEEPSQSHNAHTVSQRAVIFSWWRPSRLAEPWFPRVLTSACLTFGWGCLRLCLRLSQSCSFGNWWGLTSFHWKAPILYHHRICMSYWVLPPLLLLSEPLSTPSLTSRFCRSTSISLCLPLPPGQTDPCGQLSSLIFANLSPLTTLWRPQALAFGPLTTLDPCSIMCLTWYHPRPNCNATSSMWPGIAMPIPCTKPILPRGLWCACILHS